MGLVPAAQSGQPQSVLVGGSLALVSYFIGWSNMALKGTCRLMAVLKFCNLSSFGASFSVRVRHAP